MEELLDGGAHGPSESVSLEALWVPSNDNPYERKWSVQPYGPKFKAPLPLGNNKELSDGRLAYCPCSIRQFLVQHPIIGRDTMRELLTYQGSHDVWAFFVCKEKHVDLNDHEYQATWAVPMERKEGKLRIKWARVAQSTWAQGEAKRKFEEAREPGDEEPDEEKLARIVDVKLRHRAKQAKAATDRAAREAHSLAYARQVELDALDAQSAFDKQQVTDAQQSASALGVDDMFGEAEDAEDILNPQRDPDACLSLYNELNGHAISWDAEHPPPLGASDEDMEAWRLLVKESIHQNVHVGEEHVASLKERADAVSNARTTLFACASCGARMVERGYECVKVRDLPPVFRYTDEQKAKLKKVPVTLLEVDVDGDPEIGVNDESVDFNMLRTRCVDLMQMKTFYKLNEDDEDTYHLHPELVETPHDGSGECVRLCRPRCAGALRKDAPPKFSLAAGVDFGRLDVLGLPEPSEIERLILSNVRTYAQVVKVVPKHDPGRSRTPDEWHRAKLQGHFISFLQEGPEAAANWVTETMRNRVQDVQRKVKVHLLGPEGSHDVLMHRLMGCKDMQMRPTVVYNYLVVRAALLEDGGFPAPKVPGINEVAEQLRVLGSGLRASARKDNDVSVEERANRPSDIAAVRDVATDGTTHREARDAAAAAQGEDHDAFELLGGEGRDGVEGADEDPQLIMSHVGLMDVGTSAEATYAGAVEAVAQVAKVDDRLKVSREGRPLSEFLGNGKRLMETFWYLFPLGQGLDSFEGGIPTGATKHLMQHYTNRFQRSKGLLLVLANQVQRHTVLRSVSGAVTHAKREEAINLINDPTFLQTLEAAAKNPRSKEGKVVMKKVLPLISLCSRPVPWGAVERGSCIGKLLAMLRRYGPASLFLTLAPDDVHNPMGIRLTVKHTTNEGFPAMPEDFLQALRDQPTKFKYLGTDGDETSFSLTEDVLQRQASENPASTSMMFQRLMRVVLTELCGTPPTDEVTPQLHKWPFLVV